MNVKICASVIAKTPKELGIMVKKAEEADTDLIEIRMDYLNKGYDIRDIRTLTSIPIIATNRSPEEGGFFKETEERRVNLLLDAASSGFDFVDLELRTRNIETIIKEVRKTNAKLIISNHNLFSTPSLSNIRKVFQEELNMGADVCKIVTKARKAEDNLTCLQIVNEASKVKDILCFCMGKLGIPSRLLSPFFGGLFTYASIEHGMEAAPGQLTITDTRRFYEMIKL